MRKTEFNNMHMSKHSIILGHVQIHIPMCTGAVKAIRERERESQGIRPGAALPQNNSGKKPPPPIFASYNKNKERRGCAKDKGDV